MKYPIGIQSFDRIIEDGFVYVDKTDMLYSLVNGGAGEGLEGISGVSY